jgi:hypothetical protein
MISTTTDRPAASGHAAGLRQGLTGSLIKDRSQEAEMKRILHLMPIFAALGFGSCDKSSESQMEIRRISPADLAFDPATSTSVISSAQKFIIPVPAFGGSGEALVYPKGDEKAGKPILDYEGKPIGERGLVFFNAKDKSRQAVAGDGEGVIIINEITQEQADRLYQKVQSLQQDPNKLTLNQLKQVLEFAREELGLGDMYNSTRSFVKAKMTPAGTGEHPQVGGAEIEAYGLKKRDDRDLCRAVYVPGKFVFQGPAASPQIFEDGGVIVEQNGEFRGVQPEIFLRTYRLQDGRQIASLTSDLKVWSGRK